MKTTSIKIAWKARGSMAAGIGGHRVEADFAPGRLNLVMGPNGVGKTTLLAALALRSGSPGLHLLERVGFDRAEDVAYLPQAVVDVGDIPIRALLGVAFPQGVYPEAVKTFLQSHGPRRTLSRLSGGERQLLLFLTVSWQPKLVHVYDEPFRNLDARTRTSVSQALARLVKEDRLVIVAAHENEFVDSRSIPTHVTLLG